MSTLKKLLKERGYTTAAFAEKSGISNVHWIHMCPVPVRSQIRRCGWL